MTNNLLEQGISAALTGRRDEARALLAQVVEADDRNEQAWLWLSGLVEESEEIRTCLENVLHLNPDNVKAQQGLAWLEQRHGARPVADVAILDAPPVARLDAPVAISAPAAVSPADARSAAPDLSPAVDHPCLYCGALNALENRSCAKCRNSLMIRSVAREKRSAPLTIIGILWILGGVLQALGGLASTGFGMFAFSTLQAQTQRASKASIPFPTHLLLPLAVGLVVGGISIAIGRGLLRRERWAYIVLLVLTALNIVASVAMFLLGALSARGLAQLLSDPRLTPAGAENLGRTTGPILVILFAVLGFQLLYVLLVGLSYRDFWGRLVRFQPALDDGDHREHYNSGVIYKNRSMWYMAAQEWEVADKMKPRDASYMHALGLAYAQLKRFDQSRAMLELALQVAPADARIVDSRALVDQMEKGGGR
jgi:tetratricopeptide (TPR) repeat protein